jgi:hypothetical protein
MMPSGSGERTEAVHMAVLRDRVALTVRSSLRCMSGRRQARRPASAAPDAQGGPAGTGTGQDPGTCWIDGRLMFVAGYTRGGAPHGCHADELFS